MRIEYHPAVVGDVEEAVRYYDSISARLSDEFLEELYRFVDLAGMNPDRFHQIKPGFHRVNLKRFPYHFLYRRIESGIRVTLLRHHRRNPSYGSERI